MTKEVGEGGQEARLSKKAVSRRIIQGLKKYGGKTTFGLIGLVLALVILRCLPDTVYLHDTTTGTYGTTTTGPATITTTETWFGTTTTETEYQRYTKTVATTIGVYNASRVFITTYTTTIANTTVTTTKWKVATPGYGRPAGSSILP